MWGHLPSVCLGGLLLSSPIYCSAEGAASAGEDAWPDPMEKWLAKETVWQYFVSLGVEFSSGEYGGTSSIDTFAFPLAVTATNGRLYLRAEIPYLRSSGPAVVTQLGVSGIEEQVLAQQTEEGIGDLTLSAGYELYADSARKQTLGMSAAVKLPTADEDKLLGTGETDYTVQGSLDRRVGPVTLWGRLGYTAYGDPSNISLENVLFGYAGATYPQGQTRSWSLNYYASQAVTRDSDPRSQATAGVIQLLGSSYYVNFYATVGFSSASPDYVVGLSLGRIFSGTR
jgi:hypothetical protein